MIYRIRNRTLGKWVLDEDGEVLILHSQREAEIALDRLNEIKRLNPRHRDDALAIIPDGPVPLPQKDDDDDTYLGQATTAAALADDPADSADSLPDDPVPSTDPDPSQFESGGGDFGGAGGGSQW